MPKKPHVAASDASLLRKHRLHSGVYSRVGKKLGLDPSYISRVMKGERTSERIMKAVLAELKRIERS